MIRQWITNAKSKLTGELKAKTLKSIIYKRLKQVKIKDFRKRRIKWIGRREYLPAKNRSRGNAKPMCNISKGEDHNY